MVRENTELRGDAFIFSPTYSHFIARKCVADLIKCGFEMQCRKTGIRIKHDLSPPKCVTVFLQPGEPSSLLLT